MCVVVKSASDLNAWREEIYVLRSDEFRILFIPFDANIQKTAKNIELMKLTVENSKTQQFKNS